MRSGPAVRVAGINKYTKIAPEFGSASRRAKRAYNLYVAFGATPKTGQKTSPQWRIDLFISEALMLSTMA